MCKFGCFNIQYYFAVCVCVCVSLAVHLGIILVNNQLDAQFFFFRICLFRYSTCFEQSCAHHRDTIDSRDDEHMIARNM